MLSLILLSLLAPSSMASTSAPNASAAAVIIQCGPNDFGSRYQLTAEGGDFKKVTFKRHLEFKDRITGKTRVEESAQLLKLLGLSAKENHKAVFTSVPHAGEVSLELNLELNNSSLHAVNFIWTMSGGPLTCSEGDSYARFAKTVARSPLVSESEVQESRDAQLAMVCRTPGTQEKSWDIRAMHNSFGRLSLQVETAQNPHNPELELNDFKESATAFKFFGKNADSLILKKSRTSTRGFFYHDAQVNYQGRRIALSCEERQNYPEISKAVFEARSFKKSLPAPGRLSDLDPKFCGSDGYTKARAVIDLYQVLLAKVPGMVGSGPTEVKPEETPLKLTCGALDVYTKSKEDIESVRKVLGDSLDGMFIKFTVFGKLILQ